MCTKNSKTALERIRLLDNGLQSVDPQLLLILLIISVVTGLYFLFRDQSRLDFSRIYWVPANMRILGSCYGWNPRTARWGDVGRSSHYQSCIAAWSGSGYTPTPSTQYSRKGFHFGHEVWKTRVFLTRWLSIRPHVTTLEIVQSSGTLQVRC